MPIFSEQDLQTMRALREDNQPFRCDVEESTYVDDPEGTGGLVESWRVVTDPVVGELSNIPCSADDLSGNEAQAALQVAPAANTYITLPYDYALAVQTKHRIVVRGEINGRSFVRTYGVEWVGEPRSYAMQTTVYGRSGEAASGEPRMTMARPAAVAPSLSPAPGGLA